MAGQRLPMRSPDDAAHAAAQAAQPSCQAAQGVCSTLLQLTCLSKKIPSHTALPQNRLIWLLPCRMVVAVAPLHSFITPSSRATVIAVCTGPCRQAGREQQQGQPL